MLDALGPRYVKERLETLGAETAACRQILELPLASEARHLSHSVYTSPSGKLATSIRFSRRGEFWNFTGIDLPYEPPETADIRIDTTSVAPENTARIVEHFRAMGIVELT